MSIRKSTKKSSDSRVNLWHKVRRSPRFNLYVIATVVIILALTGYYAYRSRAAFAPGSVAATSLSLGGGAKTVTDANASSGSVVQFAATSTSGTWPTAATTGPTGNLTVVNGDVHLDSAWVAANPSKIYSGFDVHGRIFVDSDGITATNFAVHGLAGDQVGAVVMLADGFTASHCLIDNPGQSAEIGSLVHGTENKHITVDHCNLTGGEFGVRADDGWTITNNYIHDLYGGVDGIHMDGIMFYGDGHSPTSGDYNFHDILIRNNYVDGTNIGTGQPTGALFIDSGHFETNVVVDGNYFAFEAYPIRIDGSYTFTNNAVKILQPNGFGYSDANPPKDCESGLACVYPTNGKSHNMIEFVSGNYDADTKAPIFQ